MQGNLIVSVPLPEFLSSLEGVIRKVISEDKQLQATDEIYDSEKVKKVLKISSTTLQKWRNERKIPFTRIDNKIFYRKSEIMQALETANRA